MKDKDAPERLIVWLVFSALFVVLLKFKIGEFLSAFAIIKGLELLGIRPLHIMSSTSFALRHGGYEVDWSCTPIILSWCGIVLLWFARQKIYIYAFSCLVCCLFSAMLIYAATVCSIYFHERGLNWIWAHYPITILAYTASLLTCFFFSEFRQRRLTHL